ncbi:hypothetical protein HDC92_002176 [Pedobacter sp. AK017]|uniref:hypothetical protein n=1 Tax=Pedobacter sp. AK017 TaxID=2723073 RepID=UPI001615996D|nr:hypothetical protein [Pedobacter sp. AK017]MBB5438500.1 hypothetical protein [Pedobacter sp. AK017]
MTTRSINDQVRVIKDATEKASRSKKAAIEFLRQAGIISKITYRGIKFGKSRSMDDSNGNATSVRQLVSNDKVGSPVKATGSKSAYTKKAISKK